MEPAAKKFPSQDLPQLPAIRLGADSVWIVDAVERYRADFLAEHGVPIEMAQVVRKALFETLDELGTRKAVDVARHDRSEGTVARIGAFRITPAYPTLLEDVRRVAERSGVERTDVIRWALTKWLQEAGYGPKAARAKR